MKSFKRIVKSNAFNRFKGLRNTDINSESLAKEDGGMYDIESINNRLFHFFDPQGFMGKQQHTNTHNYEITNSKFLFTGGLENGQSKS